MKGIQVVKEEVKLSLFADDMVPYIENPKDLTTKLLELINEFRNVQDTKSVYRNLFHFYTVVMKYQKEKLRKQPHLQSIKKNKIPRNAFFNQESGRSVL